MILRPYQEKAVASVWNHVQARPDNPCVVIPTGGGKTPVIAQICRDAVGWGGRVVCCTHVRELVEQNFNHIQALMPGLPIGIYSAGLKSRDTGYAITVAGIQSIYERAEEFGPINVIVVDEAHRIPDSGDGMYRSFLASAKAINPDVRIVGMTATPFRTSTGMICKPDGLLNKISFEVGIRELIRDGWLSPIKSKIGKEKFDVSKVSIHGGEYVQSELEQALMADEDKVALACWEIAERTEHRKSVIVFCSGIAHAKLVAKMLCDVGETRTVFGDTKDDERDQTIAEFKSQKVKYLVNVGVLTEGFDAPGVDAVCILRPSMSPGLVYQMAGRGLRKAPGKTDCLILDFGGNFSRHGPIDRLSIQASGKTRREFKECPHCQESVPHGCEVCPDCGGAIPRAGGGERGGVNHNSSADDADVISPEFYDVTRIRYSKHIKKNATPGHPPVLKIEYECGMNTRAYEWICLEHRGFAYRKACGWWRARSSQPVPASIDLAMASIEANGLKEPTQIKLEADGKYLRVVAHKGLAMPTKQEPDNVPF